MCEMIAIIRYVVWLANSTVLKSSIKLSIKSFPLQEKGGLGIIPDDH